MYFLGKQYVTTETNVVMVSLWSVMVRHIEKFCLLLFTTIFYFTLAQPFFFSAIAYFSCALYILILQLKFLISYTVDHLTFTQQTLMNCAICETATAPNVMENNLRCIIAIAPTNRALLLKNFDADVTSVPVRKLLRFVKICVIHAVLL